MVASISLTSTEVGTGFMTLQTVLFYISQNISAQILSVTQPHAHVDTEPRDRQRHGTFNPKYFLQLSFYLSVVSLLSSPHTCFLKDFQAVGSPVVASIAIAKTQSGNSKRSRESVLEPTAEGSEGQRDCACLANFQRMCLFYISETVWELLVRFYFIF